MNSWRNFITPPLFLLFILYASFLHIFCHTEEVHVVSRVESIKWKEGSQSLLIYILEDGHREERSELYEIGSPLEYIDEVSICFTRKP